MVTALFANLAVHDLQASVGFFSALGFEFNPQFTDDTATCMVVNENIQVMLLTREKFRGFSPNDICDTNSHTEVLLALSLEKRDQVDEMVQQAVAAGGTTYNQPQDHGFMYQHGFRDLDGHVWEVFHMDPAALAQ